MMRRGGRVLLRNQKYAVVKLYGVLRRPVFQEACLSFVALYSFEVGLSHERYESMGIIDLSD